MVFVFSENQNSKILGNYSGTSIFEYNTDFIGLILKPEKFEYLILKFNKPMISMNYVYKNSGITKSSKKSHVISISWVPE